MHPNHLIMEVNVVKLSIFPVIISCLLLLFLVQFMVGCAPAITSSDIAALTAEMKEMNKKLANIEAGISTMNGDISTIRGDVSTIKSNVSSIMNDVTTIKGTLGGSTSLPNLSQYFK